MKTWQGRPPCPHDHLYMHGTKECAACWVERFDAYWAERFPEDATPAPFETGDEDYAGAEMYTKPPKKKKRTAA